MIILYINVDYRKLDIVLHHMAIEL